MASGRSYDLNSPRAMLPELHVTHSEARYRHLFLRMAQGVVGLDDGGRVTEANPAAQEILGVGLRAMLGKTLPELGLRATWETGFMVDGAELPIGAVLRGEVPAQGLVFGIGEVVGGEGRCVSVEVLPQDGEDGRKWVTLTDITRHRRVREQLRTLSTAVEQSPASVVITDTSGRIEYVNPKFEEVTGYKKEEVLGQNPRILKSGEMNDRGYQDLWRTLVNGKEWRGEFHNRRRNGELFWERAVIAPIKDEQGQVRHFLAVKEDITDQKRAEEMRSHLEAQLRESQKLEAFGQLAGGVAHDFNNILTVIHSHACLLLEGELDEVEEQESMREISRSAERASNLTAQLLAFSRRQVMQPRDLDLNDILTAMTRMLQRLIGEHIQLESEVSPMGSPVRADAGMMEQIVLNLVVNARDAMPSGGRLRIATQCLKLSEAEVSKRQPAARAGEFVCLEVSDTGSGISAHDLPRIFEPFFTTKEVGRGTGLGLSTVRGIVDQHHGWIEVESEVNRGTTFRVILPRLELTVVRPPKPSALHKAKGGSETLLVVEDEAPLRLLLRTVLERQGYRVIEAENGRQALDIWEREQGRVQLLLTDMVMPEGISGAELADRLQEAKPSLRVVFTTGYSDQLFDTNFRKKGNRFLPKPYDPDRLVRTLRECLDGHEGG